MDLVKLGTYGSTTEAELVRARLEANGIDALVQADTAAGTAPMLAMTEGVRVLVRESDLAEAYTVLERMLPPGT
jgi:hypothetical protein